MIEQNNEYYISLEVAKLLKQAGFDWSCRGYYDRQTLRFNFVWDHNGKGASTQCSAPTLDVAQRWLREVMAFDVLIQFQWRGDRNIAYKYETRFLGRPYALAKDMIFDSYEEALEAGIQKCLIILLEEKK